jgi:tRNA(fMet)-specific endonuclease VapC
VSTLTVSELHCGIERSSAPAANRAAVEAFLAFTAVLDFDTAAAVHTGDIRAVLAQVGQPIGSYDAMIAGHARSAGLTVVTNNTREFARVPGLLVVDWLTER